MGKTYGMLLEGRERLREGRDVVIGYVELHGRSETEALAVGLPQIAARAVEYRGTSLREFDLDAALARKPALLLLDELAHTNTPGSRHAKRWQDAEELLDAGIDVYTTVNVQHLESLNDIVAQFTGVRTAETVPDRVFEQADEVELIDQPPDDLLQRLREGKIYIPEQARHAIDNFFRKGNLIALRELALRTTADRVDAAMREYRGDEAIRDTWATRERLLVCVGPDEQAERLVRSARRLASALHAEWIVLYVETPQLLRLSEPQRNRRIEVLRLAESLGAEAVTLGGASVAEEALNYARTRNITRILIGRPTRGAWIRLLRPSTVDTLIDRSGDIDVQVVTGDEAALARRNPVLLRTRAILGASSAPPAGKKQWPGYAWAALFDRPVQYARLAHHAGLRAREPDHVLSAWRGGDRAALRARSGRHGGDPERGGLRLPVRPAPFHLRGSRRPVPADLWGHAGRGADRGQSHRQRAPAGQGRRLSGTAHGHALRDEPGIDHDARQGDAGAGGGAPYQRGIRQPGRGAVARCAGAHRVSRQARASLHPTGART